VQQCPVETTLVSLSFFVKCPHSRGYTGGEE
jgi:hypothetical protein